jgi:hypothetical protein
MNNEPNNPSSNESNNNNPTPTYAPDVTPAPTQSVAPATPATVNNDPPILEQSAPEPSQSTKSSKGILKTIALVLFVVIVAVLAAGAAYAVEHKKVNDLQSAQALVSSQLVALKSTDYKLPAGSTVVSPCIPSQGFHNLLKGGDKEYGPFVLTNMKHKVIGLEYMAAPDMYTPIPGTNPPVAVIMKNSSMMGWKFDHAEFDQLPKGHPGLERSHIDVHMSTVSRQQEQDACK